MSAPRWTAEGGASQILLFDGERLPPLASAGCENCRKTERTLAQALGIIERLTAADRALTNAKHSVADAEQVARIRLDEAAKWLEEL